MNQADLPELVVAADWGANAKKRWMVRAELVRNHYLVFPPEPVGDPQTLLDRLSKCVSADETALIGFDFPIGLPAPYAAKTGLPTFKDALRAFGTGPWEKFYTISNSPSLFQPFFPRPKKKGEKGNYKKQLAQSLGWETLGDLLRTCDKRQGRRNAECLFFTLGGQQVGAGAIIGWRDMLAPAIESIKIWPFDGELDELLALPGLIVSEIYPGEAYSHLGFQIGSGTGRRKGKRGDRQQVASYLLNVEKCGSIRLRDSAESWIEWGFLDEDDFDAMVGLLSMLLVVTGKREATTPKSDAVHRIEGWILGQDAGENPDKL